MASGTTHEAKLAASETENVVKTDSAESFQSFIYELFEENGILNDLRAYLRGHIVNVLKSAQTGDAPACQKNFTQRLELTYQALNMLVAEYLMRLEFSYSFSVFVSEIPLANMVFEFAKSLMKQVDNNSSDLRFKEADVWSILNYLGVQCDSEHASNIVQMYNNEPENPLLLCILKSMPMYKECVSPSSRSVDSSKYCDSTEIDTVNTKDSAMPNCSHSAYCKKCQSKLYKLKERYKKKKKYLAKYANQYKPKASDRFANSETLVKHIGIVEKSLEEMFQQMKAVYESEVEMVKVAEKKKVEQSMATHAMQLQRKRYELEEAFKAREQELELSVQHKKKFLWGLARSLREQHLHMTRAMRNVRAETERLELKEDSLKSQLAEAEQILKKRGEEMRAEIANELAILEAHLASMKKEREGITRECSELQNLKTIKDSSSKVIKVHDLENEQAHSHYDLFKHELEILKTYVETSQIQAKCVIERATMTQATEPVSQVTVELNNRQRYGKSSKSDDFDERVKMNQLVNDFKKKNVNFSQSNLDEIYERSRDRSHSSNSSEARDTAAPDLDLERDRDRDLIQRLREENDRLKAFARQRCAAPTRPSRPRTAPAVMRRIPNLNNSISARTLNFAWRKGAGEELSMFSNALPRILIPGDTLPFIGVLRDRHGNNRRPQAAGRTRVPCGVSKRAAPPVCERQASGASSSGQGQGRVSGSQLLEASCSLQADEVACPLMRERLQQRPRTVVGTETQNEDKNPKCLLKEDKETLWRRNSNRYSTVSSRDRSPDYVLREAKLRLRKLEIEAEAVEQSYRDFRRRQSERRAYQEHNHGLAKALDVTRSHSAHKLDETTRNDIETHFSNLQKSVREDFDKYMLDYKTKFDVGETYFRNKPTISEKVKPIPDTFEVDSTGSEVRSYHLEAPLVEFRKLYTSAKQSRQVDTETRTHSAINSNTELEYEISARNDALQKIKHSKQAELQILKRNINQMYHGTNRDSTLAVDQQINQASTEDVNNLRVEVESVSEINDIKSQTQDMLLVVQSTASSKAASEVFSAQMTIIVSPKRPASPSERPVRSPSPSERPVRSPSPSERPVRSPSPSERPVRSPSPSERPVRSPSPSERPVRSPSPSERPVRSPSPEQAARLTRNDVLDAIFHADPNDVSSVHMQLALSKEQVSMSEYDKGDYPDDFDVAGNYSSESDRSRISLPVMDGGDMAEEGNFWGP